MPETAHAAPTTSGAKRANRRRFVLFVVALLVAIAFGTAIFGVVLANPATVAQAPNPPAREAPEPAVQPPPSTGHGAPIEHAPPPATRSAPAAEDSSAPVQDSTPRRDATPTKKPATSGAVTYQNCNKARRAGAAPLYPGDPGYSTKLDKDGNGIACDEKK